MSEDKVFEQELSLDELENAAGGRVGFKQVTSIGRLGDCAENSMEVNIYGGSGFPNCAGTVEDGSWCGRQDACFSNSVEYTGMVDCSKAWR